MAEALVWIGAGLAGLCVAAIVYACRPPSQ